jgi:hypothetical protein
MRGRYFRMFESQLTVDGQPVAPVPAEKDSGRDRPSLGRGPAGIT